MLKSIQEAPFFKDFSAKEIAAVESCVHEKSFKKGETLFREGDSCERIFFVRSGRIKIYRLAPSGREQILESLNEGDTCACNPGNQEWHCSSSADAVTDSAVWFLSRDRYVRLLDENPQMARALNALFAERLKCFGALIEDMALKDSRKRLIKFLLDMEPDKKEGKKIILAVPFSREELAQKIGMARETLVRQLYRLKDEKLIDLSEHRIILTDAERLSHLLNEA